MIQQADCLAKDDIIRADVLKSARELFQRYGLFKTTMEDIAKAAGKGKSTLYYYYASKDEIFNAVLLEDMTELFEHVEKSVERAQSAEEKMKTYTSSKLKALIQKANLYSIMRGEISDHPNLIKKLKKDFQKREVALVRGILSNGIASKEFKKIDANDLDSVAYIMVSALRGIEMNLWEDGKIKTIGDRLDIILNLMCNGIKK